MIHTGRFLISQRPYAADLGSLTFDPASDARQAEKAGKAAAKARKTLDRDDWFRNCHGDTVTSVAGAKQALRDEREFFYNYGHGPHSYHPACVEAAAHARRVLLAREAREAGTGATEAEITQIIERADRKHKREAGL
jgi:hypothetical protein